MKILFVNKFLYPNGGSETYIFRISEQLKKMGHEVSFFGMEDERNTVTNNVGAYTANMNFRGEGNAKRPDPFSLVYSKDSRKLIRKVLDDFHPDAVHLNNINFQVTPSVIDEVKKDNIPLVWTLHDYQLICPNHMLYIPQENEICRRCVGKGYMNCIKHKCLHNSTAQSALAAFESFYYAHKKTYANVDKFICPSEFIDKESSHNPFIKGKTVVMHNFIAASAAEQSEKKDYVLYFGRYDEEKGINTLLEACRRNKDIPFVFAGKGPLAEKLAGAENVRDVGFRSGGDLVKLISEARFSVYPSEWFENCPFSVMESQMYLTPVLGADIGGIPELIREGETGRLFKSGDADDLSEKIRMLWDDKKGTELMSENCRSLEFDDLEEYCKKLLKIYNDCKK